MALTRRTFIRNLGSLAGVLSVGLTVIRPQRAFRKDYYTTLTIRGPDSSTLVGFKGDKFLQTGYVFAPYIPIFKNPNILLPRPIPLTKGKNLLQLS